MNDRYSITESHGPDGRPVFYVKLATEPEPVVVALCNTIEFARLVHDALEFYAELHHKDERIAELERELNNVRYAAHMPADYEYGLPSWINQRLYAAYLITLDNPPRTEDIERIIALERENKQLKAQLEQARAAPAPRLGTN
ncbi:MAG TPA: hypothetical protein VJG32_18075 [Anaerolineae bacterium]|nr:hypothetical protein [Anaerolineae bacterium]